MDHDPAFMVVTLATLDNTQGILRVTKHDARCGVAQRPDVNLEFTIITPAEKIMGFKYSARPTAYNAAPLPTVHGDEQSIHAKIRPRKVYD